MIQQSFCTEVGLCSDTHPEKKADTLETFIKKREALEAGIYLFSFCQHSEKEQ